MKKIARLLISVISFALCMLFVFSNVAEASNTDNGDAHIYTASHKNQESGGGAGPQGLNWFLRQN
jgi:hypothetical protein